MNEVTLSKWLTTIRVILIISVFGLIIYFNSFFNGFFADDYHQIIDNPLVHSLTNIPSYFTGSTFYTGTSELSGNYYKPILTTAYAFLYAMFGINAWGYHFIQVLLHICNAVLVFLLFKIYTKRIIALLFTLIFLAHPINTETVVYIANLQDILFLFFGLLALVINSKYYFRFKSFVVGILLVLSILSKETGILFLLIVPLSNLLLGEKHWVKDAGVSLIVFAIYSYLRFVVAHVYFNSIVTAPIMLLSLTERLTHIPYIIFFYLKTFFFPKDLLIFQTVTIETIDFNTFFLPLIIDVIFFILLFVSGLLIYRKAQKHFKAFLFFTIWFLIGLLLHIQIFPLDGTVADRWFYFPIIGLLGMLAIIADAFIASNHRANTVKIVSIYLAIAILVIFSVRVIVRNANWIDQKTLISHDIQINKESYQLEEGYGLELMKEGKLDEAYPHLLSSTKIFPGVNNLTSLGVYYGNTKQFDKAKETFKNAMQYDDLALTYENYSLLLFLEKNYASCESFTNMAVNKFPNNYKLWFYKSMCLYTLGHKEDALAAARMAYTIQQDATRQYVLQSILSNQPIDLSQL